MNHAGREKVKCAFYLTGSRWTVGGWVINRPAEFSHLLSHGRPTLSRCIFSKQNMQQLFADLPIIDVASTRQVQSKWRLIYFKKSYFKWCEIFNSQRHQWRYITRHFFKRRSAWELRWLAAFVRTVGSRPPRLALSSLVRQKPAHLVLQAQSCNPARFGSRSVHKLAFVNMLYDFGRVA